MLSFNDGVNIDTDGELRPLRERDGWYVVGQGYCIPVGSLEEAKQIIEDRNYYDRGGQK